MKYVLIVIFFITSICQAQLDYSTEKDASYQFDNKSNGNVLRAASGGNKIEGSEFLNKEWSQATVYNRKTKKKFQLLARFNTYTKEVEILKEKDIIVLSPVDGVSVDLNNITFVPVKLKGSSKSIFAEQLVKGNTSLLKVYDAKVVKSPSDASLLGIDDSDRIQITDKLYYQKNGTTLELPSKKKLFADILGSASLAFAKKEKLSLKKESDLIQLFKKENGL